VRHLDLSVNDLVDGRLDDDGRDRAFAHLAECAPCRAMAEDLRMVKGALGSLGAAEPSSSFLAKLNGIAGPDGPLPVDHAASPAEVVDVAQWRPHDGHAGDEHDPSAGTRSRWVDRHRRGVKVAATGMISTGAMMMLFATVGAPSSGEEPGSVTPAGVVPAVDQFMEEHARSTGTLPFVDPASYLVPRTSTFGEGQ